MAAGLGAAGKGRSRFYAEEEAERLRPCAQRSAETAGRRFPESPPRRRSEFQRDRDRIIHSSAFRRLQYKTQVFINHEGDHYRTRLTHTLEVAQIARDLARALRLNEDLTEATALAHDLGHTPFGHAGETVLDGLMREWGGFEHNIQSYRIVHRLERAYPDFPGLNLTTETRHGVFAHSSRGGFAPQDLAAWRQPPLEAQLADLSDEIAYTAHDLEDGLSSGLIEAEDLEEAALFRRQRGELGAGYRRVAVRTVLRGLIGELARGVIAATEARIRDAGMDREGPEGPLRLARPVVGLFAPLRRDLDELKDVLMRRLYRHPRVLSAAERGTRLLPDLFGCFLDEPERLPRHFRERMGVSRRERVVCDYVAGMTDRFARDEHRRIFGRKR